MPDHRYERLKARRDNSDLQWGWDYESVYHSRNWTVIKPFVRRLERRRGRQALRKELADE